MRDVISIVLNVFADFFDERLCGRLLRCLTANNMHTAPSLCQPFADRLQLPASTHLLQVADASEAGLSDQLSDIIVWGRAPRLKQTMTARKRGM